MGKYRTCHGACLWKLVKKIEIMLQWCNWLACGTYKKTEVSQHAKYTCCFCVWQNQNEEARVGIWHCGSCMKTVAGGGGEGQAWTYNTRQVCDQKTERTERPVVVPSWRLQQPIINGLIYITKKQEAIDTIKKM